MTADSPTANTARTSAWDRKVRFREMLRDIAPLVALLAVVATFAIMGYITHKGAFLSFVNFRYILCDSATITVAALGMMLVIAVGGIDLSAGAILGLCTALIAWSLKASFVAGQTEPQLWLPWLCLLLAICAGATVGAINGSLITMFRVSPFMVTLGAMAAYKGVSHQSPTKTR